MESIKNKKIVIIDGHPDRKSFCAAMADRYCDGASGGGAAVERIAVRDLRFDPILHFGYRKIQELEPDLLLAQDKIKKCDHLVIITPVWWGSAPALLKGFFDRTFLSGFSHRFDQAAKRPVPLLKGKSASVLYTQGSPWFYSTFITKNAFWKMLKICVLEFCGFNPIKRKYFDKVKSGTDEDRKKILENAYALGLGGF